MKELNDSELNRRYVPLVRRYAELLKQGLPDEEVAGWQAKVDKLPPIARDIVLEVTRIDDDLKDAIQGVGQWKPGRPITLKEAGKATAERHGWSR